MPIDRIPVVGLDTGAPSWDSSGNVTASGRVTSQNPAFRAYFASASLQFNSAGTVIWDTVDNNRGSCYSTSTGRFTAPVAGYYQFNLTIQHSGGTATGGYADILKNGGDLNARYEHVTGANFEAGGVSTAVYLNAGDYVSIFVSANVFWSDNSSFSGFLIG